MVVTVLQVFPYSTSPAHFLLHRILSDPTRLEPDRRDYTDDQADMVGGSKFQPPLKRAAVLLASMPLVLCISQAASLSSNPLADNIPVGSAALDEWAKATVQAGGFGSGEVKELEAYKKVLAKRKLQQQEQDDEEEEGRSATASDFVTTLLVEETKGRLEEAMLTKLEELEELLERERFETIFEFENHSCECGVVSLESVGCCSWTSSSESLSDLTVCPRILVAEIV